MQARWGHVGRRLLGIQLRCNHHLGLLEALTFGELPLEPFARADLFRTARADTLGAQAPAGLRKQITKRCVPSGPSASRASKPRSWRSGSRFQFLNLVHDRWPLVSISLPRSTNPPLGSRQSALISVTSVARPRRQHLGGGLSYASEMVPETDLGGHGRVVRTEGKSIRTALLRTCPAPSDRAQRRAPAHTCSWRKLSQRRSGARCGRKSILGAEAARYEANHHALVP